MDFSEFSSPDFNAKAWINKTFKENKDVSVHKYAVEVQSYLYQVNQDIDNVSQHVVNNLPRVIRDIEILTEETSVLKEKMDSVKQEIAKVESNTGQSIQSLERIDQIKMELQKAKQTLQEADNWTILATDVEAAFISLKQYQSIQDFEAIASKLASMQQSLSVLAHSRDFDSKQSQLNNMKDNLEILISPLLNQAFSSKVVEHSKKMAKIFIAIDRLQQLINIYSITQKSHLLQQWEDIIKVDTESGVLEAMKCYYDFFVLNWKEQLKWCEQVFPKFEPSSLLIMYTQVLVDLVPKFSTFIDNVLQKLSDPIIFLTLLKQQTKIFSDHVQQLTEKLHCENKQKLLLKFSKSTYAPFVNHISKYGTYEQAAIHRHTLQLTNDADDLIDSISAMVPLNEKVLNIANEAKKRCYNLTEGVGYPGLSKALEYFFNNYLDKYKLILKNVDTKREQLEHFNIFQMCSTYLQSLGDLTLNIKLLDADICQSIIEIHDYCNQKETQPFQKWDQNLLNFKSKDEWEKYYKIVKEKKEGLFATTLNTLEKLCKTVHQTTFDIVFAPIQEQLEHAKSGSTMYKTGMFNELPDYSIVPQEYITQIGQYLMTLPQHLEPFLVSENPGILLALTIIDPERNVENINFAEVFLSYVSNTTCKNYCDVILSIDELSPLACKQVATDIDYLGNVLEDLGFSLSNKLKNITLLLRLSPSEYATRSAGCNLQLISAIRRMRNLTPE